MKLLTRPCKLARRAEGRAEEGQTLILVAVALTSILAMAALAIDVVTLYTFHTEAQHSADAAALAGAKLFVDSGFTSGPCPPAVTTPSLQTLVTQQAAVIAQQNKIGGQPPTVTVTFPNAAGGCSNPEVSVEVQRSNLPTFFARIWSTGLGSVSATAVAEAYNPSNSAAGSAGGTTTVPVAPRCVKPLLLPNCDPNTTNTSTPASLCGGATFIDPATGNISNPSTVIGATPASPITADCQKKGKKSNTCIANAPAAWTYYPVTLPSSSNACPGCSTSSSGFQSDLECCNPTPLACGQQLPINFAVHPNGNGGPAAVGGQCMIHQVNGNLGQDVLDTSVTPFQLHAGGSNPFVGSNSSTNIQVNDIISTSDSIVTVPLYDGSPVTGASTVTVVGYLQLFINGVSSNGDMNATILNVIGCGSSLSGSPVLGSGTPIPVRLIHN